MEAVAKLMNDPTSPRKMRLVADLVRNQPVSLALNVLKVQPKHAARKLEKLLMSAVANWQQKNPTAKIEDSELYVKTIYVDGGRALKRLRPAPQGRGFRVLKRSNHVTIVVDSSNINIEIPQENKTTETK